MDWTGNQNREYSLAEVVLFFLSFILSHLKQFLKSNIVSRSDSKICFAENFCSKHILLQFSRNQSGSVNFCNYELSLKKKLEIIFLNMG